MRIVEYLLLPYLLRTPYLLLHLCSTILALFCRVLPCFALFLTYSKHVFKFPTYIKPCQSSVIYILNKGQVRKVRTIQVNYEAVEAKMRELRSQITTNIVNPVESEYRQLRTSLMHVDGETCASLQEALDDNCQKTIEATSVLERLLSFMANSCRQIQMSEERIARSFSGIRR